MFEQLNQNESTVGLSDSCEGVLSPSAIFSTGIAQITEIYIHLPPLTKQRKCPTSCHMKTTWNVDPECPVRFALVRKKYTSGHGYCPKINNRKIGKVNRLHNRIENFPALFWALGIVLAHR